MNVISETFDFCDAKKCALHCMPDRPALSRISNDRLINRSSQKMALDLDTYAVAFQSDLLADFAAIFDELESRGWIEVDTHRIRYVGLGQFHIPLIQALFSYARLAELRSSLKQVTTGGTVIPISEVA